MLCTERCQGKEDLFPESSATPAAFNIHHGFIKVASFGKSRTRTGGVAMAEIDRRTKRQVRTLAVDNFERAAYISPVAEPDSAVFDLVFDVDI